MIGHAVICVLVLFGQAPQPLQNPDVAKADQLEKTAVALANQRQFSEAVVAADEALAIRERLYGKGDPEVAATLHYAGYVRYRSGSYAAAETHFRRALTIWRAAPDASPQEMSTALNDLGSTLQQQGLLREAEPLLIESLEIQRRAELPPAVIADAYNNLGGLLSDRGDYARAREHFERAEQLLAGSGASGVPRMPVVLNSLGLVNDRLGDLPRAETYYRRSLALREADGETIGLATTLNNLAASVQQQGRLDEPEALYKRALAVYEKLGATQSAPAGQLLNNMAAMYLLRKDLGTAGPLYERALAIREAALGRDHPSVATSLQAYAIYLHNVGRTDDAIAAQSRATDIVERQVGSMLEAGSEAQKESYLDLFRDSIDITLWLRAQPGASASGSRLALLTVLRRKGRIQEVLAASSGALRAARGSNPDIESLARARAALARVAFQESVSRDQREQQLKDLQASIDVLEAKLNGAGTGGTAAQSISLEGVQGVIPRDTVLIEFFRYRPFDPAAPRVDERFLPARYVACALRREGEPVWMDLGDAASLDANVAAFRAALLNPERRDVRDRAAALRASLTDPLGKLAGAASHVYLSPDGDLNLLPFQALVGRDDRYLVEDHLFTYLTSGRELLAAAPSEAPTAPVIVANPEFGPAGDSSGPVSRTFLPLPGADAEATAVSRLLSNASILRGPRATEASIKALHRPAVLHIATHGFFLSSSTQDIVAGTRSLRQVSSERPVSIPPLLRSGLALAGANRVRGADEDDGILTASEAAMLDLHGTRLVFLSACESGLGVVSAGESVYGLRRAFAIAGARTQVLTLWQVSDGPTRTFVVDFYRRLQSGAAGGEAIRSAQLAALRDTRRAHPFYWAAFIFSGKP